MTKKHFEAIAAILKQEQSNKSVLNDNREQATWDISHRLADYFQSENPRFNRERFLQACNVK